MPCASLVHPVNAATPFPVALVQGLSLLSPKLPCEAYASHIIQAPLRKWQSTVMFANTLSSTLSRLTDVTPECGAL